MLASSGIVSFRPVAALALAVATLISLSACNAHETRGTQAETPPHDGWIFYRCGGLKLDELCRVRLDGSARTRLTDGAGGYTDVSVARSTNTLAFTHEGQVFIAPPDLRERRRLAGIERVVSIALHPAGRQIAVVQERHSCVPGGDECIYNYNLLITRVGGGQRRIVRRQFVDLAWLGRRLVVPSSDGLLSLLPPSYRRGPLLAHDSTLTLSTPAVSPDNRFLAATAVVAFHARSSIVIFSLVGRRPRMRFLTRGHNDFEPAWSPDGRRIVFNRDRSLYVVRVNGGGPPRSLGVRGVDATWG